VCDPRQESNASLSRLMIGSEPAVMTPRKAMGGEPVLRVQGLSLTSGDPFGTDLHGVALQVCAGEVVGIAGVSGNGQRELMWALSGEDTRRPGGAGALELQGCDIAGLGPVARRRLGLHFVPEERLGRGAVPSMSLAHNLLLTRSESLGAGGWIRAGALAEQASGLIERFRVKAGGPHAAAQSLSGGNLQKFIVKLNVSIICQAKSS
jgi:simple sugar transport system ATP-binding protein